MAPDWQELTPDRYEYSFVRREFLGALRCLVYDVRPKNSEDGGFAGRIFIEDRTFNIVRFAGRSAHLDVALAALRGGNSGFRVDSWRMNVAANRWVPAYAYVEEVPPLDSPQSSIIRGQVRFWGYDRTAEKQPSGVAVFLGASPSPADGKWHSPEEVQRIFKRQGEENVLARLSQAGLLATPGEVEMMLDQVVTNLVITNRLVPGAPIRCRVLLTSRLDAFSVGNTIVLSRGLIDVLPNESAIALVLAHQLAHNVLGHPNMDTKFAFPDVLEISDAELLAKLRFRHSHAEEAEADARTMQILRGSPYGATMNEGGLFVQAIQAQAKRLSALISPTFGENLADVEHVVRNDVMLRTTPVFGLNSPGPAAALPLGSRLMVNPWDGGAELLRSAHDAAPSANERAEFAVTPFAPYLQYFTERPSTPKSLPGKNGAPGPIRKPAAAAPSRRDGR
jgi:hypothetical protein